MSCCHTQLAGYAWRAGCRHPRIAEALCASALAARGGSTAPDWRVLATRTDLIAGRQTQLDSFAVTVLDAIPSPRSGTVRSGFSRSV